MYFKHLHVVVINLLGSHFPYSLWTTIYLSFRVHLQVALLPCGESHSYINQKPIGHFVLFRFYHLYMNIKTHLTFGPAMAESLQVLHDKARVQSPCTWDDPSFFLHISIMCVFKLTRPQPYVVVFQVTSIADDAYQETAAVYLQVSIVSQALIFVTRSHKWSFMERPGFWLLGAFIVAQLIATLIAVYASWGFAKIRGCGWRWAGVVWLYEWVFITLDLKFIHNPFNGCVLKNLTFCSSVPPW